MALQSMVQPRQMSTVAFEQQVDQAALLTNILKGFVQPRGPDDGQMSHAQASSVQVTPLVHLVGVAFPVAMHQKPSPTSRKA